MTQIFLPAAFIHKDTFARFGQAKFLRLTALCYVIDDYFVFLLLLWRKGVPFFRCLEEAEKDKQRNKPRKHNRRVLEDEKMIV